MATNFLKDVIDAKLIKPRLESDAKNEIILELIDMLDQNNLLADRKEAERVVLDRERMMSTGLENGIAIPHGKCNSVKKLIVAVGLKPDGMDFECADGQPARIFLLTLSPASRSGPHIRFMAEISRLLQNDDLRGRVLAATTGKEIETLLTGGR
jgi:mannitol/fructose-specific phosphotransferase system IIA component (Ntr-type)